jgi:hypothetical protein
MMRNAGMRRSTRQTNSMAEEVHDICHFLEVQKADWGD